MNTLADVVTVLILLYFPIAIWQLYRLAHDTFTEKDEDKHIPVKERRLVIAIVTNGAATNVVEKIIKAINRYEMKLEIFVIKEERDRFKYSANQITVPVWYETKKSSKNKERALQYGIEYLHDKGYGPETYIVHLDDDSVVDKPYLEHVLAMREEAGQGNIRLRQHGKHLFSTLADFSRVSNCVTYCTHFNKRNNRPFDVHGEGIVSRADVEYKIGWDFGTYGAEDMLFGMEIAKRNLKFGYIPHFVFIAPPLTARDFLKQRRRWNWSVLLASDRIKKLNPMHYYLWQYRYLIGWTGFISLLAFVPLLIYRPPMPMGLTAILVINTVSYFLFYQYGAYKTDKKYMPLMLILQFPIAFYEGMTLLYSYFTKANTSTFETIKKI